MFELGIATAQAAERVWARRWEQTVNPDQVPQARRRTRTLLALLTLRR